MKKSDYYVGIEDHQLLRRNILESTKGTIKILQRIELIKSKRSQKITKIIELKKLVEDINYLIENLKKELPKIETHFQYNEKRKTTKQEDKHTIRKKPISKRATKKNTEAQLNIHESKKTNLNDLENELDDIESKLKNLGR